MKILKWIKSKKPKSKKAWIALSAAAVLIASSAFVFSSREGQASEQDEIIYSLERGDIEIAITGNGTVFSSENQELDPDDFEAEVKAVYFNEGDTVKEGDLLYELESSELLAEWQKASIAYDNAVLEYKTSSGDVSDLTVRAPISGVIETLDLDIGETLANGETVATVWDKNETYVKAPFNLAHDGTIEVGQSASMKFPSSFAEVDGKVVIVESTPTSDGNGGVFMYVYIAMENPGGMVEGEEAVVEIHTGSQTIRSITNGLVEYKDPRVIESPGEATVEKILKQEKDYVEAGEIIAVLKSDSLVVNQMSQSVSMQEAKLELDNLADKVENLQVRAEKDGILAGQDVSVGDVVGVGSTNANADENEKTLGQIISLDKRITIAVDELDINKVELGQMAQITVDAAPDENFEGEVVKISEIGDVQSGVATYDVTLSVPYSKLVKEGMSADGEILIESSEDAVLLPIEAVTEARGKKLVTAYIEDESGKEEKTMVPVETGLMDARYYEVLSGLEEGDKVVLTGLSVNSSSMSEERPGGMMPGMGAGSGQRQRPAGN